MKKFEFFISSLYDIMFDQNFELSTLVKTIFLCIKWAIFGVNIPIDHLKRGDIVTAKIWGQLRHQIRNQGPWIGREIE